MALKTPNPATIELTGPAPAAPESPAQPDYSLIAGPGFGGGQPASGPAAPPLLKYVKATANKSNLVAWGCKVEYRWDRGVGDSPLAGKPGENQTAVWQVHSGRCLKIVTWAAQSVNGKPPLPSHDTGDPNDVLKRSRILAEVPSPAPDGAQMWTVVGRYTYVLLTPPKSGEALPTGAHPLSSLPASLNSLNPSDFLPLLKKGAGQGGFYYSGPLNNPPNAPPQAPPDAPPAGLSALQQGPSFFEQAATV